MGFKPGQKIIYTYVHSLNAKSRIRIKKRALFLQYHLGNKAVIWCVGNKNTSIVDLNSIYYRK